MIHIITDVMAYGFCIFIGIMWWQRNKIMDLVYEGLKKDGWCACRCDTREILE